jgi:hypothetical protein
MVWRKVFLVEFYKFNRFFLAVVTHFKVCKVSLILGKKWENAREDDYFF